MALFWEIWVWIILKQDTVEKGCKNAFQRSKKSSVLPCRCLPSTAETGLSTYCLLELSAGENCLLERTVSWRELSARENCLLERIVCWRASPCLSSASARAPGQQRRCGQSAAGNLLVILTTVTAVSRHHFENCKPVLARVHAFCRSMKKRFLLWLCVSKTCWNNCVTVPNCTVR